MMYGLDRKYTGVRGDGIRVNLLRIVSQKTNLSNFLFAEKDIEDAIYVCWTKSNFRHAEGFTHMKALGTELDSAINICLA